MIQRLKICKFMQLQHMPSYYPRELGEGNVVGVERRSSFSSCPNKEEFFFLFFYYYSLWDFFCYSLPFSCSITACRRSPCPVCCLPALLQVAQAVVKLHFSSHYLWIFWLIDKWLFFLWFICNRH